jgi:polar amino acid transport system substrate-binding protein
MYVNPTRAEQVDFVPYLKIGSRVVVRKGNPANITGRDLSLCGKNIAVTLGGIEESQAGQTISAAWRPKNRPSTS